ncbi:MAG TPA: hypothetical protein VLB73_03875 [Patescibacteria group bacterium]|nr:hypothetical protein [Patescibacteria group bacterium]
MKRKHMTKKTKIIIIFSLLILGVFTVVQPVSQVSALNGNTLGRLQEKASDAAEKASNQLTKIQQRGDAMITVRLTSLQNLLTRIQNDKKLSADEKTAFQSDINTTIASLTALKTKLDADTDATTALADAKSIVTSYRIYMIFEPKIRLTIIIDNLQSATTTISGLITKIQTLLDTLKSQGKDVTTSQNALNDATTQVNAINTILATDKSLVNGITINTANPQSIFVQVRKDLATVRADVAKIRSDFATIRGNVKLLINVKTGAATTSAQ